MPSYSPLGLAADSPACAPAREPPALGEQNLRFILGLKLHHLRTQHGLSLAQLSKGCGLSVSYLNEIEKGKKFPKSDKLLALAAAFGVSYDSLVSLDPGEALRPLAPLLATRALHELPLDELGIVPGALMEMMVSAPDRLGILLRLLATHGRRHGLDLEDAQQSALRAHLESANYHFPELEEQAVQFARTQGWPEQGAPTLDELRKCLKTTFGWEIDEHILGTLPEATDVGAVPMLRGRRRRLLLHSSLPHARRAYFIAREIAASLLDSKDRMTAPRKPGARSFSQILNNARAGYLAGALLVPSKSLVPALEAFFARPQWAADQLVELVARHGGDPEVVFHRIAQLLNRPLGLGDVALTRTEHVDGARGFEVTRDLCLGRVRHEEGAGLHEHRCLRASAIPAIRALKPIAGSVAAAAQRSRDHASRDNFLTISVAFHRPLVARLRSCMTLAFALTDTARQHIAFWADPAIPERLVGDTCERCGVADCEERAAPAHIHQMRQRRVARNAAIETIVKRLGG